MIDPLDQDTVAEQFPEMIDRLHNNYGYVPNSMLTMAHNPDMLAGFSALAGAVMGEASTIPVDLRWMIAHMASRAAGCKYCQAHTGHNAAHLAGLAREKFDEIWNFETSDHFSDAERAALSVAVAGAQVPNEVDAPMLDELRNHYNERQVVDIVGVIAFFGFLNRWNDTMATELEDGPKGFATDALDSIGWTVGKHQR